MLAGGEGSGGARIVKLSYAASLGKRQVLMRGRGGQMNNIFQKMAACQVVETFKTAWMTLEELGEATGSGKEWSGREGRDNGRTLVCAFQPVDDDDGSDDDAEEAYDKASPSVTCSVSSASSSSSEHDEKARRDSNSSASLGESLTAFARDVGERTRRASHESLHFSFDKLKTLGTALKLYVPKDSCDGVSEISNDDAESSCEDHFVQQREAEPALVIKHNGLIIIEPLAPAVSRLHLVSEFGWTTKGGLDPRAVLDKQARDIALRMTRSRLTRIVKKFRRQRSAVERELRVEFAKHCARSVPGSLGVSTSESGKHAMERCKQLVESFDGMARRTEETTAIGAICCLLKKQGWAQVAGWRNNGEELPSVKACVQKLGGTMRANAEAVIDAPPEEVLAYCWLLHDSVDYDKCCTDECIRVPFFPDEGSDGGGRGDGDGDGDGRRRMFPERFIKVSRKGKFAMQKEESEILRMVVEKRSDACFMIGYESTSDDSMRMLLQIEGKGSSCKVTVLQESSARGVSHGWTKGHDNWVNVMPAGEPMNVD